MKSITFPVNSILAGIQGEGARVGTLTNILRLDAAGEEMTIRKVIWEFGSNGLGVVITGDEPTKYKGLSDLITELGMARKFVAVETDGSREVRANWITVSPRNSRIKQKEASEIKVRWHKGNKRSPAEFVEQFQNYAAEHFFIMPVTDDQVPEIISFIKRNAQWRLGFQMQKIYNL